MWDEDFSGLDLAIRRHHHGLHRELEALRKLEVPLVVSGDGHDRSGAVPHEDVVRDPDRQPVVVHRVRDEAAREDACLLLVWMGPARAAAAREDGWLLLAWTGPVRTGAADSVADVVHDLVLVWRALGEPGNEGVLGCQDEEGGAEQGVGPRREDGDVDL